MITESNEEMPAHPDAIREDLLVALINGAWVMKLHEVCMNLDSWCIQYRFTLDLGKVYDDMGV